MKEKYFHNKVSWFTFTFSILVIWAHSFNAELFLKGMPPESQVGKIEHFLGDTVGQIAVPGFFMISAYLFYRNFYWGKLRGKWKSRIRSVAIPFLLWNAVYYAGYVIGSRLPFVGEVMGKGVVEVSLAELAEAVMRYRYNNIFWYLWQLILLILLAPVIYLLLRRRYVGIAAMAALAVVIHLKADFPYVNEDALFYYSIGAYAALHGRDIAEGGRSRKKRCAGAAAIVAAAFSFCLGPPGLGVWSSILSVVVFRAAVPAALWILADEIKLPMVREWMENNFFLYAVHFAVVRLVNKTAARLFPGAEALPLLLFLIMPVIVLCVGGALRRLMNRFTPWLWNALNGGRAVQP